MIPCFADRAGSRWLVPGTKRPVDDRDLPAKCPTCSVSTTKRLFTVPILLRRGSSDDASTRDATDGRRSRGVQPALSSASSTQPPFHVSNVEVRNFRQGTGFRVSGDGVRFVDCSATGNQTGFRFRGSSRITMENTRSKDNRVAFDVDGDVEMVDRNTVIE